MSIHHREPVSLEVADLAVKFPNGATALRGIDLSVRTGEVLGLVGESGSGKTTVARALLGLLPRGTTVTGSIRVATHELVGANARTWRTVRGDVIGYVGQDPYSAFDPRLTVGTSVAEAWHAKGRTPPTGAALERLAALGVPDTESAARRHPHTWSGGMLQRAAIAAATALEPALVVADEPTSALDAELADATLTHLRGTGSAVLLITHDLGIAARHTDRLAVMYAGHIVETGHADVLVTSPRHPYTQALIAALPRPGHPLPEPLPGEPPSPLRALDTACPFAPRCRHVQARCLAALPTPRNGVSCAMPLTPGDRR
ncbi:ABC transporter ATP-binding protein [Yinghuangia sp. YIM S09857]|uniref:ABC transporter ATP-binding protein n=1 Tax=Yinghuangia sp. YIM S09857 TaxID=3436929 RepID=UPI003F530B1D